MFETNFSDLLGQVITKLEIDKEDGDEIRITTEEKQYLMYHDQDCCEHVYIEDICGDLEDIKNSKILLAEEVSKVEADYGYEEWTFYKLSTIKGSVTIRWNGSGNGYYSTSVSFKEV
jgi:hypothetical protein